jgi:Protein of unknown function (DUF3102)
MTNENEGDNARGMWASKIKATWRLSVEAICATGQLLAEAKADLPHGQFTKMIESETRFSVRTAQRLMAIGQDKRIAEALNTTHAPLLPGNWGTLYELTRLSDDQFRKGLESGIIRPDMERSEVAALFARNEIDVIEASALAVIERLIDIIESLFDGGRTFSRPSES